MTAKNLLNDGAKRLDFIGSTYFITKTGEIYDATGTEKKELILATASGVPEVRIFGNKHLFSSPSGKQRRQYKRRLPKWFQRYSVAFLVAKVYHGINLREQVIKYTDGNPMNVSADNIQVVTSEWKLQQNEIFSLLKEQLANFDKTDPLRPASEALYAPYTVDVPYWEDFYSITPDGYIIRKPTQKSLEYFLLRDKKTRVPRRTLLVGFATSSGSSGLMPRTVPAILMESYLFEKPDRAFIAFINGDDTDFHILNLRYVSLEESCLYVTTKRASTNLTIDAPESLQKHENTKEERKRYRAGRRT